MHGREAQNVQRNERKQDVKHSEEQGNEQDVNLEVTMIENCLVLCGAIRLD